MTFYVFLELLHTFSRNWLRAVHVLEGDGRPWNVRWQCKDESVGGWCGVCDTAVEGQPHGASVSPLDSLRSPPTAFTFSLTYAAFRLRDRSDRVDRIATIRSRTR